MDNEKILGTLGVLLGLSGWLLPYRWNLLRLKGRYARFFSEETNKKVPKALGTILIIFGLLSLFGRF